MPKDDAIWALGCMSGTSMDGVDAAMVLTDGIEVFEFGATGFRPYSENERKIIRAALGQWPKGEVVPMAAAVVEAAHLQLIARFGGVDLVGFHGQTLAHDPDGRHTHQAGNGADLARACGHDVVWDFRSADVNAGGQGAPLAPFYHFALARRLGPEPVGFLNIGGVGNLTFVDAECAGPTDTGALLAFDTGPGNALLDDFIRMRTGLACDYGGALAAAGQADQQVVSRFLQHGYFGQPAPKSLDRNEFALLAKAVRALRDTDGAATLSACSVAAVAAGFAAANKPVTRVLVCGGGRKNDHIMARLAESLPVPVVNIDDVGFDGDMLEAQAFAYLAVRSKNGLALTAPGTTGVKTAVCGGVLSCS